MRLIVPGLFALTLVACGDDSGGGDGGTAAATGSTGTPTTGADDDPGSTTDDPSTTSGPQESSDDMADTMVDGSTTLPDDTGSTGATTGEPVAFELTSTAFKEGGTFPGTMHVSGGNVHPQLDWVGAPEGTQSFGVFFHDVTISFEHSAIWNIPATETGLPEDLEQVAMPAVPAGAVQCQAWSGGFGYGGPGSQSNMYQFTLYALDTADLSGEITQNSTRPAVRAALEAHMIESTTLSGVTNGP